MLTGIEDIQSFVAEAADPIHPHRVAEVRTYLEKSLELNSEGADRAVIEKCIQFVSRDNVSLVDLMIVSYIVNDGIMMRELSSGDELMGVTIQDAAGEAGYTDSEGEEGTEEKGEAVAEKKGALSTLPPPDQIPNPFQAQNPLQPPESVNSKATLEDEMSEMERFMRSLDIETQPAEETTQPMEPNTSEDVI